MVLLISPLVTGCEEESEEERPVFGDAAVSDTGVVGGDSDTPDAADPADAADSATLDACLPSCGTRQCGDDACGGSCGECDSTDTCTTEGMCEAAAPLPCPPVGPYGTAINDIAPDVTLLDCEGVEYSLHDLCDAPVSWVFEYAEWCPICQDFAPTAQALYERHQPDGLQAYVVISANADFGRPDAELCAAVRMRYGLTMPVLYDPTGAFSTTLEAPTNDYNLIMTRGMRIRYEVHYGDATVETQLAETFASLR